jgi:flagellar biosynthesis protein FliR
VDPIGLLVTGGLVAGRISGMFLVMPVYSMQGIPTQVRVFASLALAAVVAPVVPTAVAPATIIAMVLGMASEVMVGVLIGGVVRLVFGGLALAGEMMGAQTGHAAALQFDPTLQLSQGPVGAMGTFLASAVFVGLDFHLQLFLALSDSFYVLPPGGAFDIPSAGVYWIQLAGEVIQSGAQLAAPIIAMVFMTNLFVAVVTRLSPQMNIFFSLGMMLNLIGGQVLYYIILPHVLTEHVEMVRDAMGMIPGILQALKGT